MEVSKTTTSQPLQGEMNNSAPMQTAKKFAKNLAVNTGIFALAIVATGVGCRLAGVNRTQWTKDVLGIMGSALNPTINPEQRKEWEANWLAPLSVVENTQYVTTYLRLENRGLLVLAGLVAVSALQTKFF